MEPQMHCYKTMPIWQSETIPPAFSNGITPKKAFGPN